jgi:hypothetical protein
MNQTNYQEITNPLPMMTLDDNSTDFGNGNDGGWKVTDTQIIIPPDYISDFNTTVGNDFGDNFGISMALLNSVIRSDGNSTDVTIDVFSRQIRVVRDPGVNETRSDPRPNAHKFSHIGVGGKRALTGMTYPHIEQVETVASRPAGLTPADGNATWLRTDNLDVLSIKGYGLDLAFLIEFVDGEGNLIQATDANGFPPAPISLRSILQNSALVNGVEILDWPASSGGGLDGYEIRISPVSFGMSANSLYDTVGANNVSGERRVVIRTPFGTAIAPKTQWIWITN